MAESDWLPLPKALKVYRKDVKKRAPQSRGRAKARLLEAIRNSEFDVVAVGSSEMIIQAGDLKHYSVLETLLAPKPVLRGHLTDFAGDTLCVDRKAFNRWRKAAGVGPPAPRRTRNPQGWWVREALGALYNGEAPNVLDKVLIGEVSDWLAKNGCPSLPSPTTILRHTRRRS